MEARNQESRMATEGKGYSTPSHEIRPAVPECEQWYAPQEAWNTHGTQFITRSLSPVRYHDTAKKSYKRPFALIIVTLATKIDPGEEEGTRAGRKTMFHSIPHFFHGPVSQSVSSSFSRRNEAEGRRETLPRGEEEGGGGEEGPDTNPGSLAKRND